MSAPCSFFAGGSGLCFEWLMLQPVPRLFHYNTPAINATFILVSSVTMWRSFLVFPLMQTFPISPRLL